MTTALIVVLAIIAGAVGWIAVGVLDSVRHADGAGDGDVDH